jgi:hypothetical protein
VRTTARPAGPGRALRNYDVGAGVHVFEAALGR